MIFEDPVRTIRVELLAGWTYDPFNSSLTDLVFTRWDRQEVLLIIHVRRATVAENQSDEQWIEQVRTEFGMQTPLLDGISHHGRAVVADLSPPRGIPQRVAFVRGRNVELIVEQRGTESGAPNPWAPLEKAVLTASSEANRELTENGGRVQFNEFIEKAHAAVEKKDLEAVMDALGEALRTGIHTWLRSLSSPDNVPEINAVVRAAQVMSQLGQFSLNSYLLRDAEYVLRRAHRSLQDSGSIESSQELVTEISEVIGNILSELLEESGPESGEPLSPVLAARERGLRFSGAAEKALDAGETENACSLSEAAVESLLSLISFLRQSRSREIPEEIMAQMASQGITDLESQRDAIQNAREAALLPPLNTALQIQYCCALEQKNPNRALESTTVLVTVAQQAFTKNPEDAGPALNLTLALMDGVGALALLCEKDKLDLATRCLEEGQQVLDGLVGEQRCTMDVWMRYCERQIDGTQQAIAGAMEKAAQDKNALLEAGLQPLRAQFEKLAGRFRETLTQYSQ